MVVDSLDSLEATALLVVVVGEATCNNALVAPVAKASTTRTVPTAAASSNSVAASLAPSHPKARVKVAAKLQQLKAIPKHHHLTVVLDSFPWSAF
jgi:hypothetical protein